MQISMMGMRNVSEAQRSSGSKVADRAGGVLSVFRACSSDRSGGRCRAGSSGDRSTSRAALGIGCEHFNDLGSWMELHSPVAM
jgi:hypothetical protein